LECGSLLQLFPLCGTSLLAVCTQAVAKQVRHEQARCRQPILFLKYDVCLWPKTIDFGQDEVPLENGPKTVFSQTEIAKGFWPPLKTGGWASTPAFPHATSSSFRSQIRALRDYAAHSGVGQRKESLTVTFSRCAKYLLTNISPRG